MAGYRCHLDALADLSGAWIDRVHERRPPDEALLGALLSSCSATWSAAGFDLHSAEDWRLVLEPVIARHRARGVDLSFRADAAFAKPEVYELLEAEGIRFAIRLPANQVLQERTGDLKRPVGRPPKKPIVSCASFRSSTGR